MAKDEVWFRILKAKYFPRGDFRDSLLIRASQFWKSIHKVKSIFNWGASYKLGNGRRTYFWHDVWLDDCPLKIKFALLYRTCSDLDIKVAECLVEGVWQINFARTLGRGEEELWRNLKENLDGVVLDGEKDQVRQCLEKNGHFIVKSMYRHLAFGGVTHRKMHKLWSSRIPLKVKIFLWQIYQNSIQTADQLSARNWKGGVNCIHCGVVEDAKHVLFQCVLVKFAFSLGDFHRVGWMIGVLTTTILAYLVL